MLKFIHAADFHLDSAFAALPAGRAAERRRGSRAPFAAPPPTGTPARPWRRPWGG